MRRRGGSRKRLADHAKVGRGTGIDVAWGRVSRYMARVAVLLALISGAAHAAWNALAKVVGKEHAGSERLATLVVLTFGLVTGLLALPGVALPMHALAMPSAALPYVLLAGAGESAYVVSLGIAYARGDLSLTYAISRATALVVIWPISWLLFGTTPSALALGGTALVLLGIVLSAPPRKADPSSPSARWSVPWTLATGASVGLYHAGYKGAVEQGGSPIPAFVLALCIAVPLLWIVWWRGWGGGLGPRISPTPLLSSKRLWLAGALSALSFILLIVALRTADSGRMLGVRNSSVGFAIVIALLLGERPSPRQWAGLVFLGLGVLSFGYEEIAR